jgi:hypothetical protein
MCMFCAAIPTAATLGVVVTSRRRTAEKIAQAEGKPQPKPRLRLATGPVTAGVVALLVMGSIFYHTHYPV